jgi:hypothetical protein
VSRKKGKGKGEKKMEKKKQIRVNLSIGDDTLTSLEKLIKAEKEKSGLDISLSAYVRMLVHRAVKAEKD